MNTELTLGSKHKGILGEWIVTCAKSYYTCLTNTDDDNFSISFSHNNLPGKQWEGHIAWPYSFGGSFDRQPSSCRYETLQEALDNFEGEPFKFNKE